MLRLVGDGELAAPLVGAARVGDETIWFPVAVADRNAHAAAPPVRTTTMTNTRIVSRRRVMMFGLWPSVGGRKWSPDIRQLPQPSSTLSQLRWRTHHALSD